MFFFLVVMPFGISAADFSSGSIKLTLHERTGRFYQYHSINSKKVKYETFFAAQDPRTSFLAVICNDKVFRLGESLAFRMRIEDIGGNPAIVFESSFLVVTEEFSFIKTAGASASNGIKIRIQIENKDEAEAEVGLRFLLDTYLGERGKEAPFITNRQNINAETAIERGAADRFWVSRNNNLSLMGSIYAGTEKSPDLVLFSNWKRQNEIPWKTAYSQGRNFNDLPYSIDDSSVCYYYDPVPVSRGEQTVFTLFLAAEDEKGFGFAAAGSSRPRVGVVPQTEASNTGVGVIPQAGTNVIPQIEDSVTVPLPQFASGNTVSDDAREVDLALLRSLVARLDEFVAGNIELTGDELTSIERTINTLKARNNLP
jgi:hypothetical protein